MAKMDVQSFERLARLLGVQAVGEALLLAVARTCGVMPAFGTRRDRLAFLGSARTGRRCRWSKSNTTAQSRPRCRRGWNARRVHSGQTEPRRARAWLVVAAQVL